MCAHPYMGAYMYPYMGALAIMPFFKNKTSDRMVSENEKLDATFVKS